MLAPVPTFVLAVVLLVGALIALIAQSWVLGIMLLAFAAAVFVLFYGAAERDPSSSVARAALGTVAQVSGWTRFAQGSAGAWGSAGRRLFDLRRELRPLRAERREVQSALGDAAYRQDEAAVASLRARMSEIDDAIAANCGSRTRSARRREIASTTSGSRSGRPSTSRPTTPSRSPRHAGRDRSDRPPVGELTGVSQPRRFRMRTFTLLTAILAVLLALVALAGCGDDDEAGVTR